jgi:hypothetical protein
VDYAVTATKAVLHTTALYRERFLFSRYQMGRDTIEKFQKEPPYAYIVPRAQWDPPTAARMLDNLVLSGIDVYQADDAFEVSGIVYPAGTWLVPMDQAFSRFVKAITLPCGKASSPRNTFAMLIFLPMTWPVGRFPTRWA